MTQASQAALRVALHSRNDEAFDEALRTAVTMGGAGDQLLAEAADVTGWRRVLAAAALGDVRGPDGAAALRRIVTAGGPGTSDARCAALLALTKREQDGASEILTSALADRDPAVREYALLGLAAYGDARSYDLVMDRLKTMTARRRTRDGHPSPVVLATIYLLRHAGDDHSRTDDVRQLLASRIGRLTDGERRWLTEHWPAAMTMNDDATTALPDAASMHHRLLEDPLLSASAVL